MPPPFPTAAAALKADAAAFRILRDRRLARGGLPLHALASALYGMAAAKPAGSSTRAILIQAADNISRLADPEQGQG
ncbi:MAG TPA: hypothetical protein VGB54_11060 [Allosphingosinicella sp.]|jgi:uncharacterized protein (DUF2461 family)